MKITIDTNLLVRIVIGDDAVQTENAVRVLDHAETVVIPSPCLCEVVWVLGRVYDLPKSKIALSLRAIIERKNVVVDTVAVAAGLQILDVGGDFADGAIAASGVSMGGNTFVSFDRKALQHVEAIGLAAQHPANIA